MATRLLQDGWQDEADPWVLRLRRRGLAIASGIGLALATGAIAPPALAAERIYVTYGLLGSSTSVESLEAFARDGTVQHDLASFTRYLNDEQLAELQRVLSSRAAVSPVAVAQFLYTPQGEIVLRRLGEIIQTESNLSGFYALRAALILAAADPDQGLTPLNVLRQFPLDGIRINLERTLELSAQLEQLVNQTQRAIATVSQLSALEAATEPITDFSTWPDLGNPGAYRWQIVPFRLADRQRDRRFDMNLYLPAEADGTPVARPLPVVVISHGLGSDRATYAYLAEHLASYGFVVALPDHPGSNAGQLQALIEGRSSEVADPREFIDRPLDIQFLLDYLTMQERRNPILTGRLDLNRVGVIGQSFGGYTALAVAGGAINRPQLEQDCDRPEDSFNLSLLLQCRALALPDMAVPLQDERVKAVMAINPIGSSVLGETGFRQIHIPTMIVAGSDDTVAPALLEQIYPFTWLTTPARYLVLLGGSTHFSTIGESAPGSLSVPLPKAVIGTDPALARRYVRSLSVAFLKTYLDDQTQYSSYLRPGYLRSICSPDMPIWLLNSFNPEQLAEALTTNQSMVGQLRETDDYEPQWQRIGSLESPVHGN